MERSFDSILKKRNRKHIKFVKWWHRNCHKIFRCVLFPIWIVVLIKNEISENIYRNMEWQESRTIRILDKILPYEVEICDDELCYCIEWSNPWATNRYLHFGDRIYGSKYNYKILEYLKSEYQIDGYEKYFESPSDFEHWIVFIEIQD